MVPPHLDGFIPRWLAGLLRPAPDHGVHRVSRVTCFGKPCLPFPADASPSRAFPTLAAAPLSPGDLALSPFAGCCLRDLKAFLHNGVRCVRCCCQHASPVALLGFPRIQHLTQTLVRTPEGALTVDLVPSQGGSRPKPWERTPPTNLRPPSSRRSLPASTAASGCHRRPCSLLHPLQMRRHPQWLPMEPRTLPGCTTGRHRPVVDAYGPVHRCPGRPCGRLPFRRSRCCQRLTQPALARLPEDSSPTSTTRRGLAPCVCARIAMRTPPLRLDEAPRPKLRSRSQHSPHPSPAGCRLRCARQTSLPAPRLGLRAKAPPPRPSAEADKPA